MSGLPPEHALAQADLGDTVAHGVLKVAEKSLLALGEHHGHQVVIKLLLGADAYWAARFAHEIAIYRAFRDTPPPVRAPRLVHTDGARLLVIEHLAGTPLDTDRYPIQPVPADALQQVLDALSAFATWCPPTGVLAPHDYTDRLARYHRAGWFSDTEHAALRRLLAVAGPVAEPNHGDPLPANLLLAPQGCGLLDWEFTALFLAGFDLAMLSVLLTNTPGATQRIRAAALARPGGSDAAWLVNRAVVLARERRIHTELPPSDFRARRLALLDEQRARLRGELLATGGPL